MLCKLSLNVRLRTYIQTNARFGGMQIKSKNGETELTFSIPTS